MNNFKIVEIRDRATFIPALAMRMIPENGMQELLFNEIGYRSSSDPCIILMALAQPSLASKHSDEWGNCSPRTMPTAHKWIEENYDEIEDCQVIDVEYILKEVDKPCLSLREERIDEMLTSDMSEESKLLQISTLYLHGLIKDAEHLRKYSAWDCRICGKRRFDKFISVVVHKIDFGTFTHTHNVKYCNDNVSCKAQALVKSNWIKE